MATEASLLDQLRAIIKFDEEARTWAEAAGADDFVSMLASYNGVQDSNYAERITAGIEAKRGMLASFLVNSQALQAHLLDWAEFIPSLAGDPQSIIDDLIGYMRANSKVIESRVFTSGAVSAAGGNTGDGLVIRLTKDETALEIENRNTGSYSARCVNDANTGANRNAEEFLFESGPAGKDAVEEGGGGLVKAISCVPPRDSELINASFDNFGGTAALPTSMSGWTTTPDFDGTGTDYSFDSTEIYLPSFSADVTPYSIDIKQATVIEQRLDKAGITVDQFRPYYLTLPYNRSYASPTGFTGTLAITMGSISNSVVLSGASPSGWALLPIVATPDETLWYKGWRTEAPTVKITVTYTSGALKIDDLLWSGMFNHDGSWYVVLPGRTPFRAGSIEGDTGDTFSWTDSATESILQRWFWRHFGRYLPHAGSATSGWEDPT